MRWWLVLLLASCAAPLEAERTHLVVLHTNDIHGQVLPVDGAGGLPEVAAYVATLRETLGSDRVLVLDGGDWFQGTVEGRAEEGATFVEALAAVGYDAMAVGNHEFDNGLEVLWRLLEICGERALLANVFEPGGDRVRWARPYRIVERAGLRIGVVGFVSKYTPDIVPRDARALDFRDPVEVWPELAEELGERVDLPILLTHQGLREDLRFAEAFPELPLIVGGHSHTTLPKGREKGETLIVQAGSRARSVGRVDLWLERDEEGRMQVVEAKAELVRLGGEGELAVRNLEVDVACAELVTRAEAEMGTVVGQLAEPLERTRGLRSSSAGNWFCDLLREKTGADVGLHNKGGLRANIEAGDVTRRELFGMLPFANTVVVLDLPGDVLHEAVRSAVEERLHAGLDFSGLRVVLEPGEGGKAILREVSVGAEPIELDRRYRVATNSYLAEGGDGYFDPESLGEGLDTGLLLWELAEWGLQGDRAVRPDTTDRYRTVD